MLSLRHTETEIGWLKTFAFPGHLISTRVSGLNSADFNRKCSKHPNLGFVEIVYRDLYSINQTIANDCQMKGFANQPESQGVTWKELHLIFWLHFMEEQGYEPNPKSKRKWEKRVKSSKQS